MRRSGFCFRIALCTIACVCLAAITAGKVCHAASPLYLGEYCWEVDDGSSVRLGITLTGDGHFTFAGRISDPGSGTDFPVHGNLEIVGSSVVMSLAASTTQDETVVASVGNVVLAISTLDGTSDAMHMIYEGGVSTLDHEQHDLFSVSCDKCVSPDGKDRREELKRIFATYATTPGETFE